VTDATTVELDAQYRQLREECGLLDRSDRGKLIISGAEAAEYLQGQLTNDVESLAHMQADMRVLCPAPEEIWIDTEPEALEAARRHLEMYKIGREVAIADLTAKREILSLIGPRSVEIAGTAPLPRYACETTSIGGSPCLAVGTEDGIDLIAKPVDAGRLREALLAAGAVEIGPDAAEVARIEAGRPRFGAEMGTETMPAEAGIVEDAVSFTKGCYIGQEPVARLHYRGHPNRHLRGLELSGTAAPGASLKLGEKEVGRIGSICVSPARGPIALAIVRREAEPGAELAVGEDGVTARVVDLPFG
jgi:folate-binding protein YgfZ